MSSNFEYLGYKAVANDPYLLGIATVRLYGKVVLKFKHAKSKDGRDSFFAAPSITLAGIERKEYIKAFQLDSISDNDMLEEFVRMNVLKAPSREAAELQPLPF